MALQPNLVLGAIGLVVALVTGAYIGANWEPLTGLSHWEASFESDVVRLPERGGAISEGQQRDERHDVRAANVTRMSVDLTWQDPVFNPPEFTLAVKDPSGATRGTSTHRGGASGINFDIELIPSDAIPTGDHRYDARGGYDGARDEFESRWPANEAGRGNWTFEIQSRATNPGPPQSASYLLRVEYEYYAGAFAEIPKVVR